MIRQTSIEAFHKLTAWGMLSKRRQEVYEALWDMDGPATASELHKAKPTSQTKNDFTSRLRELRNLGVVAEREVRRCRVTGQHVLTWELLCGVIPSGSAQKRSPKVKYVVHRDYKTIELTTTHLSVKDIETIVVNGISFERMRYGS